MESIIASSPDAGLIKFSFDYGEDLIAVHKALGTDFRGAVALHDDTLIGMAFGDLLRVQWAGGVREAVYLSNLRVHPDFRRRGVASGLAAWGFSYIEELLGPQAVIYGAIMEDNVSLSLARKFQFQSSAPIQGGIVPMRKSPPEPPPGLSIRLASGGDLPAIAEGMNAFYRQHDLWSPVSSASLRNFLDQKARDTSPNELYVVTRGEHILGGLSLSDRTNLVRMRISSAPIFVHSLGALLGVLPKSGILRALTVRRVWFEEGELEAGRYLWEQLRFQLRERGNCLGIAYDPRDQLAQLFQIPFWLPMFKARYLVRASHPIEIERLIYCVAGP